MARRYASLPKAAEYVGCTERSLYRQIAAGRLPAYRLGRILRVDLDDIDMIMTGSRAG
jgi:excisionase family DNA binding protein